MTITPDQALQLHLGHEVVSLMEITIEHAVRSCSQPPEESWPRTTQLEREVAIIRMAINDPDIPLDLAGSTIAFRYGKTPVVGKTYEEIERKLQ